MTDDPYPFLGTGEFRQLAVLAAEELARLSDDARQRPLGPLPSADTVRERVEALHAGVPTDPARLVRQVVDLLSDCGLDTASPLCFGWLNPSPRLEAVLGALIAAGVNPQLARWDTNPAAVEVEQRLVRAVGERFGYGAEEAGGSFTNGGAEANLSALVLALTDRNPSHVQQGVRSAAGRPRVYVSAEAHHTIEKAAVAAGLGRDAVRWVPVDDAARMDVGALREGIRADRSAGDVPAMAVATLGTTSLGVFDPIAAIADVCAEEGVWLHADAAYGGALAFTGRHRPLLDGISRAASITFDPHKLLAVPFGCGLLLTRRKDTAAQAFGISAAYSEADAPDHPYTTSLQWTRRFAGLPLLFTVAVHGWDGLAAQLEAQLALGDELARRLADDGWTVDMVSALPVVCFHDGHLDEEGDGDADKRAWAVRRTVEAVNAAGRVWLASTTVPGAGSALRASVTSHRTTTDDLDVLIGELGRARAAVRAAA